MPPSPRHKKRAVRKKEGHSSTADFRDTPVYELLHSSVRTWIEKQDPAWEVFRPIQSKAIPKLIDIFRSSDAKSDFIVSAPTASGKTEAVFLPLASVLHSRLEDRNHLEPGASALYICPLTALIDQQARRFSGLFDSQAIPIVPWHADSKTQRGKKEFLEKPAGVVIITPESLEAQLMRHNTDEKNDIVKLYRNISCIVIDEFHAFFDNPRGYQLISQMARLDALTGRTIPRIALSATFNKKIFQEVKSQLRPENISRVEVLLDDHTQRRITYSIKCFIDEVADDGKTRISRHDQIRDSLYDDFSTLSSKEKGLIFTNSRQNAEHFSSELHRLSGKPDDKRVFLPHHGSLSAEKKRAAVEAILQDERPTSLICTTTLELGLDIGSITQVGQIDPPSTVSSMQQRLGRSGRKYDAISKLIVYVREAKTHDNRQILTRLHFPTFQTFAQIVLVEQKEFEPPDKSPAHLSTLIQQILSYAKQQGSISIKDARKLFLENGPFHALKADDDGHLELVFANLSQAGFLELPPGGDDYNLGYRAESLQASHHFFAAFQTGKEFSVYGPEGYLGQMPLTSTYRVGDQIVFNGSLWTITSIRLENRVIRLDKSSQGHAPVFPGDPIPPSRQVIETMRNLYARKIALPESDQNDLCEELYQEGLSTFKEYKLDQRSVIRNKDGYLLFPWRAQRTQNSLVAALRYWGLDAMPMKMAIYVAGVSEELLTKTLDMLSQKTAERPVSGHPTIPEDSEAARYAQTLLIDKHDRLLSPYLQRWNYASFRLNMSEVPALAKKFLGDLS